MSDILAMIAELEKSLRVDATIEDAEEWRPLVQSIEGKLEFDKRQPPDQKRLAEQLRSAVSDAIRQIREQWPSRSVSSALIASGALNDKRRAPHHRDRRLADGVLTCSATKP